LAAQTSSLDACSHLMVASFTCNVGRPANLARIRLCLKDLSIPCQSHLIKHILLELNTLFGIFFPPYKLSTLIYKKDHCCCRPGPFHIPPFLSIHLPVRNLNNEGPFLGFRLSFQSCMFKELPPYDDKLQKRYSIVFN
jgi:hypothetical protein